VVGTLVLSTGIPLVGQCADSYPSRPIRLIAQFPPGSSTDIAARTIGQKLSEAWGQQVVVDNRSGAGGRVGTEMGAKALPDGYTLTMSVAGPMSVAPALYPKLSYDVLRDFAPLANLSTQAQILLANLALPVKTVPDLVNAARARPGTLNYASIGPGSFTHLAMELVQSAAGIKLNHIPFKSGAVAHGDLMSGQVQLMVDSLPSALTLIKSGKVRGVAVTSLERQKLAPDLPTVAESGYPGFEAIGWLGVVAPAKTPAPIRDKLTGELVRIAEAADTQERFNTLGFNVKPLTGVEYARFIGAEINKWRKVVKDAGVKVED
jgi:tripartite-type tricarboxylate transporter receptor subunit TctC